MSRWATLRNLPLQYLLDGGATNCGSKSAGPSECEATLLDIAVKHPPLLPLSLLPVAIAGLPDSRYPRRSNCRWQALSASWFQCVSAMPMMSAFTFVSMYSRAFPDQEVTLAKYMWIGW